MMGTISVLNYNLKNCTSKRGNTYTKPTEKRGEIQYVPVGYFTFLTLVMFFKQEALSRMPRHQKM